MREVIPLLAEGRFKMRYVCQVCGFVYDEDKEKVLFRDLPEDWKCPLCRAPKTQFRPAEEEKKKPSPSAPAPAPEDIRLKDLSAGQLAALCTNLSRACEKQYRSRESELFAELADYFERITPPLPNANGDNVLSMLNWDIGTYPECRAAADADHDRGAARTLVWGEKVSRMLASLLERYRAEGESLLDGTQIWVCTACGFVYIGDTPPEQCPVCRVPAWKFEKTEGRA